MLNLAYWVSSATVGSVEKNGGAQPPPRKKIDIENQTFVNFYIWATQGLSISDFPKFEILQMKKNTTFPFDGWLRATIFLGASRSLLCTESRSLLCTECGRNAVEG